MPIEIDPSDPLGSLKAGGVQYTTAQTDDVSEVEFGGEEVTLGGGDGVLFDMKLPSDSGLKVIFTQERFGTQVSKLWKSELQAEDKEFDDTVYITTQTEDKLADLIKVKEVSNDAGKASQASAKRLRDTIRGVILLGGTIGVDGSRVLYHICGETTDADARNLAHFVAALLTD